MAAYLTVAEVRARRTALASSSSFPDAEITRLVSGFEKIVERYRGVAFTPRTATETITYPERVIAVRSRPLRSVTSFTVDGIAGTVGDLKVDLELGRVWDGGWTGAERLVLVYSHGLDYGLAGADADETLLEACAEYVRARAFSVRSGTSRDVISQAFDGATTRYSTPDFKAGRPTGFLDVDALVNGLPDYRLTGTA